MKRQLTIVFAMLVFSAISLPAWSAEGGAKSLRGSEASAEDQAFDEKAQIGKRPGVQKLVTRSFQQQPPVIPHATNNFDEITLEENQCLTCHGADKFKEKKAPKIGDSHFRNFQTGEIMKQVSSARHNCMQCHVPQTDTAPLVENTFKGVPQPKPKAR